MADVASVRVAGESIQVTRANKWYILWLNGNERSRSMELQTVLNEAKSVAAIAVEGELTIQLCSA
jgi:hypothetical protein